MANLCPVCKSNKLTGLFLSTYSSVSDFVTHEIGSVRVCICLDCGNLSLSQNDLKRLKEKYNAEN